MPENPGIPPLFRDIFKNAYLPYRDPETLRAFLKIIDEFEYDHSERLGDAFEYLLSVLGSQGDAGQFRTPRHIIDFVVAIVDPKKHETVLDPACGTAGFLISSYKHILKANTDAEGNSTLTPDDKGRLAANFKGYDISPDMVRLSLVNMYLHGLADPHIFEYDTLTSQDRWNEYADVVLANPPFMSPKGGIKPHNRFSVQSKRSEVLFVDYMAEHLTPGGRAGIIVPEGLISQSQSAYTQLRRMLVEDYLVAVVSLPAGVFNPYSGVKTSILILDRSLAKQTDTVAFFKIENDGFGLGAQRRPIDKDDLPQACAEIAEYLRRLHAHESVDALHPTLGLVIARERIAANGDYNLTGERYRDGGAIRTTYALVPARCFMKASVQSVDPRKTPDELFELWSIPAYDAGRPEVLRGRDIGSQKKLVSPGDVLLSRIIPHIRRACVVREAAGGRRQVASTEWLILSGDEVLPEFLRNVLISDPFHARFMQTITGVGGSLSRANPSAVGEIRIPLPLLEVQQEIVAEIEGYHRVIDGARAVLDHYRPRMHIRPDWPVAKLGDVASTITPPVKIHAADFSHVGRYAVVDQSQNAIAGRTDDETALVDGTGGLVIFGDHTCVVKFVNERFAQGADGIKIIKAGPRLEPKFVYLYLLSHPIEQDGYKRHFRKLRESRIVIPPLATQQAIVAELEAEQALVDSNRQLIARFEKKIQVTLARVWGECEPARADA